METIGRLAGGVAHDFNNLLTAITGYADLAIDALASNDPARADIEELRRAADRATGLTRQLLAFARRQKIEPRVCNLNELVLEMDKLIRRLIGEDIELITLADPDLERVQIDPAQIEQVLVNLVVNARDAMPQGGRIVIETANVALDAAYTRNHASMDEGSYVMLAVSDTGIGMDAETQEHIFEPFFTTKGPGKGTGLGLATCYGIIKQHGGYIWPYSEPGRGTSVKIYLPRAEAAAEELPRREDIIEQTRGTEAILLVEDETAVRNLAVRVLRDCGYTVQEACDGLEALQLIETGGDAFALLVTDVVMPRLGGRELADRLRARQPDLKLLFMSGYTDDAIIYHGRLNPGVNFLHKPFAPSTLARKVRQVLDSGRP
jgi:CheY-like chemotaxis protein